MDFHQGTPYTPGYGGAPTNQSRVAPRNVTPAFHVMLLIVTLIVGVLAWFLCNKIYQALLLSTPRPLLVGLIFVIFYLLVALSVLLCSNVRGIFCENVLTGSDSLGSALAILLLGAVALFGLAALFQWLYSLGDTAVISEPTSYVFIIDDSGSMETNDPNQVRYDAIGEVLQEQTNDFPFMVYAFAGDMELVREMAPCSEGVLVQRSSASGGTAMLAALNQVISDYESGLWAGGTSPKVILLTDGYASDMGAFFLPTDTINRYIDAGITISTVGLGSVDGSLLSAIARATGGVYLRVEDASHLATTMTTAGVSYSSRDLLSLRYESNHNILLGLLRVLFLAVLGTMIGFLMAVAYGFQEAMGLICGTTLVKAVLGAVFMELGTGMGGISDQTMWCVLWILLAATCATFLKKQRVSTRRPPRSSRSSGKTSRTLFSN